MPFVPGASPERSFVDVVIIGAGPYGLSIAAHLNARAIRYRIFGSPMSFWADQMPRGMRLKSEGFASSLFDPGGQFTLQEYCRQQGLIYQRTALPVPVETFVAYGRAFQKKFVPNLEERCIVSVERSSSGFRLEVEDGEVFTAGNVIVAVGIGYFSNLPAELKHLDSAKVTHSSAHGPIAQFEGKRVAVLGGGSSAVDLAALLHEAGADVSLIARRPSLNFHQPPKARRSLYDRIFHPMTPIGGGIKLLFYVYCPQLFRLLPRRLRILKTKKVLGPAPGWWTREQVVGKVPLHCGASLRSAEMDNSQVLLHWSEASGARSERFDHVIAATGYDVDIKRVGFLSHGIVSAIETTGKAPKLSAQFESSVSGLYFVGVAACNTFGPLLRFACGAGFAARTISRRLTRAVTRAPEPIPEAAGTLNQNQAT